MENTTDEKPKTAKKPATKKATTKINSSGKVRKPTKAKVQFKDANEAVERGIELFDELNGKITDKLTRATALIEDIHRICADTGVTIPELEKAMRDSNQLKIYATKLDKYLTSVKDEKAEVDKKVAILGVMVELSGQIDQLELLKIEE